MNTWQVLNQVASLLTAKTWDDQGGNPVFDPRSIIISVAVEEGVYLRYQSPIVILSPQSGTSDSEEPTLLSTGISARLVVVSLGDARGEAALMGAYRVGDLDSRGRGLLEVERSLMEVMALANGLEGIEIEFRAQGQGLASMIDDRYVVARDYQFNSFCSTEMTFEPVALLGETVGADVVVHWRDNVTMRYDFDTIVVRRKQNLRPAGPTDGAAVQWGGESPSVTDAIRPGVWFYGVWVAYKPYGPEGPTTYSAPLFAQVVT